jgi:glycosyltransferase involved in cell wall biosynthesis
MMVNLMDPMEKQVTVAAVITARNEEKTLPVVLASLQNQTFPPSQIVIVNDGSTDKTANVARAVGCKVVNLPYHEKSYVGTEKIAERFNIGVKAISINPVYIMISGADDILPPQYIETIMQRMESNPKLVVASGQAEGELTDEDTPRGAGRIIRAAWWQKFGNLQFPVLLCWESWIVYKALQTGYESRSFRDILFIRARQQKRTARKLIGDGRCMYSAGYHWGYVLGRCVSEAFKRPKASVFMLAGWALANLQKPPRTDLAEWVKQQQRQALLRLTLNALGKFK